MPATLDHLREDHEEALERADRANRALQAVGQGRPVETVRAALLELGKFVDSLLKVHIPFEEEVLFPMLNDFDEIRDTVSEVVGTNETLRSFIGPFAAELRAAKPDAGVVVDTGNRLATALLKHMRLGNRLIYPFARRMLNRDHVQELDARMRERTATPPPYPLPIIEM